MLHSSEATSRANTSPENDSSAQLSPEDLGVAAARQLLEEIRRGGCVDRGWEWLATLMLTLGGEEVGRVLVGGPLEPFL